jgi:hypothetical protein
MLAGAGVYGGSLILMFGPRWRALLKGLGSVLNKVAVRLER